MQRKKILLVCYGFYPEISPRSFRAFELVKEFSRLGHDVTVVIPNNDHEYNEVSNRFGINIIKIKGGYLFNKNIRKVTDNETNSNISTQKDKKNVLFVSLKKLYKYFHPNGRKFEYFYSLFKYLKKEKKGYDLTISIAMPISTHLGVALGRLFNRYLTKIAVADYGDPFTFNPNKKQLFYYKFLETFWLKHFDYVTIPISAAKEAFKYFNIDHKIKIIPQGFDMSNVKLKEHKKENIPYFAYAGVFYEKIRDPKILFDFLITLEEDFRFVLYTNTDALKLVEPYVHQLKDKLIIKNFIPREECITELSQYDFLINMQNVSSVQSPSKLIDYALTKRPVFNFDQMNFDRDLFIEFLNGNYSFEFIENAIKLNKYDIRNVANQFLMLLENNKV